MRTVIKMFFYQLYFYYKKQLSIFLINSHLNELYLSTFIRFYNYFLFVLVLLLSLLLVLSLNTHFQITDRISN